MTTATSAAPAVPDQPQQVWKALAPLISAPGRRSMRLYNPQTGKFSDTGNLTQALPTRPAALYPFTRKGLRTTLLFLDFDDKRGDRAAVNADLATATEWLTRCGGKVVTDHSPNGAHLLCPLAIGTTASFAELRNIARLLAARLPTLDANPNTTDPQYACLSAPGTPAKHGGYRQLDGTLADAVDAFTTRSESSLLPRLYELLAVVQPRPVNTPQTTNPTTGTVDVDAYCTGTGAEQRLAPEYVRNDPMDPDITAFAEHGVMATGQRQWDSPSEARMAVIHAAIARGHSRASIAEHIAPGGPWHHGLGQAFARYQHRAGNALERDFTKALTWLCTNHLKDRHPQHKRKNSPGGRTGSGQALPGPWGPADLRHWLSAALHWADHEFTGKRYRWTVHAVLQTLAWHALTAGELINGVWVVGVGGRNLSLGTGLLSADTVWRVLRDLRDRPGAPLILTRQAVNDSADYYALTTPHGLTSADAGAERVRIEPVHDAWWVAGHHLRRIYELIAYYGLTARADIFAAARVSGTAGDETLTALEILGLITRTGRGTVAPGATTLDSLATAHDTDSVRHERIARYRTQRDLWHAWLDDRDQARLDAEIDKITRTMPTEDPEVARTFWAAALANGPPSNNDLDSEQRAIELVADLLGARIVASSTI
ncbi:hypothetical protein P5V34_05065 [Mycobacteroides abscessus subsp. abscessus]|jgi:hypothetical protein|uniref:hypothetical protein n=1 Tax=Mycobacteroides abscessus TaxID=36809 RepID=UPI00266DCC99|nr:hypothetical protein [Mycobacteroides abscessus]MDO3013355.1 hypothetical protein [Mycobacteroides abscessus subsp. abscessus]